MSLLFTAYALQEGEYTPKTKLNATGEYHKKLQRVRPHFDALYKKYPRSHPLYWMLGLCPRFIGLPSGLTNMAIMGYVSKPNRKMGERAGWLDYESMIIDDFHNKPPLEWMRYVDNHFKLTMVLSCENYFAEAGQLEEAFVMSYVAHNVNNYDKRNEITALVERLDKPKLREAGHKLPKSRGDKYTIYRGCAGDSADDAKQALSWTLSKKIALFFAERSSGLLDCPAQIYKASASKSDILFYTNERRESEVVIRLPPETIVEQCL